MSILSSHADRMIITLFQCIAHKHVYCERMVLLLVISERMMLRLVL